MHKVAVFNRKGGVGKTTTTVNLASTLSTKGKKVLIVDVDPQINATTYLLDNEQIVPSNTLADYLSGNIEEVELHNIKFKRGLTDKIVDTNITVIPSSKDIEFANIDDAYILKKYLERYEKKFDYCFFDCPPSLSDLTTCALVASNYVLVPLLAERDSVNGYEMVLESINGIRENGYNNGLQIIGIFINAFDKRRAMAKSYYNSWHESDNPNLFQASIRNASDISNASDFGKPVNIYKKTCPAAKEYDALATELMKRIKKYEKEC